MQELENEFSRHVVERARRLVAQKQLRIFGKGARNGDALLLAPRKLRGKVVHAFRKAHFGKDRLGIERVLADLHGDLHVFERRQVGHQIVELKDEPDVGAAIGRQPPPVKRSHVFPVELDLSARCAVHAAQKVEKGGLPGAGRAENNRKFAVFQRKGGVFERVHADVARPILFTDVCQGQITHFFLFAP